MTQPAIDPIDLLLASTFGPTIAAEVAKEKTETVSVEGLALTADAVEAHDVAGQSSAHAVDSSADLPRWWKYNLDGTPRKRVQAPKVYGDGSGSGEAKRLETDRAVLAALHAGAETLAQLVAATGFVKVTVVRSVERLEQSGRVVKDKAPPTGKRGRRAFVFRPTTEPVVEPATATSSVPADGHEATE